MEDITVQLVRRLIDTQFPQWRELEIRPVTKSGHDNRTFHLGHTMAVRLPSGRDYVPQVEKEAKWLPYLAEKLSLPISCPVAVGSPSDEYPFPWSVNGYLEGETALEAPIPDLERFAEELAAFLAELQTVYTEGAPAAGEHNFFRGANPIVYHEQVKQALQDCQDGLLEEKLRTIWEKAIASQWERPPVWIHEILRRGTFW